MSEISQLIAQLCPQGVLYKALGEIGQLVRGNGMPKTDFTESGVGAIHYGQIYTRYGTWTDKTISFVSPETAQRLAKVDPGDVVITNTSENLADVGKAVAWVGAAQVVIGGHATVFKHDQDPKFIAYWLQTPDFYLQKKRYATGTKVIDVSANNLAKIRIPVPPLEVQREIVRILDKFTQLEAELKAELERRRRQYEHYRNQLLTFPEIINGGGWATLGEIAEVRSGWGFPNAFQGKVNGNIPFYKVSDMNLLGNETLMARANNYVTAEVAKKLGARPAPIGTIIFPKIGAAVATNKKRILSQPAAYDNNVMGLIPGGRVESRFLYYWLQTVNLKDLANDSGAVPSIRKSEAELLPVPLPAIEEQRSIVAILDKFDALVNDLSSGLPAELAARRKQYEYYRDKLLTFEEAAA